MSFYVNLWFGARESYLLSFLTYVSSVNLFFCVLIHPTDDSPSLPRIYVGRGST